uniref:Uncharacterized protein n=1 Tax=Setaria viridis TaxID=4556 RepID=A0A4U6UFA3_SETVI|nr:hypothetical protein SEVIR_5G090350v2 [Setaria viridis]
MHKFHKFVHMFVCFVTYCTKVIQSYTNCCMEVQFTRKEIVGSFF